MILRHATTDAESALEAFDLGDIRSQWLDEVAEIVSGLVAWRDGAEHLPLDRQVVVADDYGEIVAVAAHERVEHERLGPLSEHRYLVVVAVRADHQRSGDDLAAARPGQKFVYHPAMSMIRCAPLWQ